MTTSAKVSLRIGARVSCTTVLGPGKRYALWVQGCPFACPGCTAPQYLPFVGGEEVPVAALMSELSALDDIEGVTFSGGEPIAQSEGIAALAQFAKSRGLSVIAYTGYRLRKLRELAKRNGSIQSILDHLDVLVDGPYDHALNDSRGLRGSSNQCVHFLTERYLARRHEFENAPRRIEACSSAAGTTLLVGVPSLDTWRTFAFPSPEVF